MSSNARNGSRLCENHFIIFVSGKTFHETYFLPTPQLLSHFTVCPGIEISDGGFFGRHGCLPGFAPGFELFPELPAVPIVSLIRSEAVRIHGIYIIAQTAVFQTGRELEQAAIGAAFWPKS